MVDWLSPKILAPEVHGAIGFGFFVAVFYRVLPFGVGWLAYALAAFLGVVILKEAVWDPRNEPDEPFFWAGAWDLACYLIGLGAGLLLVVA